MVGARERKALVNDAVDLENRHLENQAEDHGGHEVAVSLGNFTGSHPLGDGLLEHSDRAGHVGGHFADVPVMVEEQVAEEDGIGVMKRADTVDDGGQLFS